MKKRKITIRVDNPAIQNPVAKYAHKFNKSRAFCHKKTYDRKAKHMKQEVSSIRSVA